MKNIAVHFSSNTDMWATPADFFAKMRREFRFTTDVCAIKENAKCRRFFSPAQDGLKQKWTGICWMNPPYGRQIKHWVQKAYQSSLPPPSAILQQWFVSFLRARTRLGSMIIASRVKCDSFADASNSAAQKTPRRSRAVLLFSGARNE
jgi:hypothetical protein